MQFLQAIRHGARLGLVAAALAAASPAAQAQGQQPSAAALATAKEIVAVTGATSLFTPLIAGVVEQAKLLLLQQNPNLSRELTDIGDKLRVELAPRFDEMGNEMGRLYATRFSEQELKDLLAFYKSPLGRKVIVEQPVIVDSGLKFAQTWANNLSDEVIAKMRAELKKRGHAL
jgi:hypothetical protein